MTQPAIPVSQKKTDAGRIPGKFSILNGVEMRLVWQVTATLQASVILHGRNPGTTAINQALVDALFPALLAQWQNALAIYSPTTASVIRLLIRDMSDTTLPIFQSTGLGASGTSASPLMPPEVALVLTENIVGRGRGAKGRLFIPGWATNADAGGGVANSAVQTAMNTFGVGIANVINANGLSPAVAKPARQEYIGFAGAVHPARPASMALVQSYTCRDLIWDAQRRRRGL